MLSLDEKDVSYDLCQFMEINFHVKYYSLIHSFIMYKFFQQIFPQLITNISRKAEFPSFQGFWEHVRLLSIKAVFFFEDDQSLLKWCLPLPEGCTEVWFKWLREIAANWTPRWRSPEKEKKLIWTESSLMYRLIGALSEIESVYNFNVCVKLMHPFLHFNSIFKKNFYWITIIFRIK